MIYFSKEQLLEVYTNNTQQEATKLLDISITDYYKLLKKAGITLNKKTGRPRKYEIKG